MNGLQCSVAFYTVHLFFYAVTYNLPCCVNLYLFASTSAFRTAASNYEISPPPDKIVPRNLTEL
jgi:hypothetical protein